jgi:RNA polymerase sigma factor (sigma-70 family)
MEKKMNKQRRNGVVKDSGIMAILKRGYMSSQDITNMVIKYQRARNPTKKQAYKDEVFNNISRFIAKSASRYKHSKIDNEDLFQAGVIGFCEAIEKFNPKMGFMFMTYLKFWVDKNIYSVLYNDNLIHTPRNVVTQTLKRQRLAVEGKPVKYNKSVQAYLNTGNLINLDDQTEVNYHDIIAARDTSDEMDRMIFKSDVFNVMQKCLNYRERSIIEMRYLNDEYVSLKEVGKKLNLSTERIRQIEMLAIKKLRKVF